MSTSVASIVMVFLLALSFPAGAQSTGKVPRVGVLANGSAIASPAVDAFRQGLRDLGHVEGQNIALEIRWADGRFERLPELAEELVRWRPNVLVTAGPYGLQAARRATTTIPIVMISCDPAEAIVERIARPSGHITGVTCMSSDLTPKRLQLLKETVPSIRRVAVLYNPFDVLRGAKPTDVPVEQATRFELVINLKTAKALGITFPQTLLLRADQAIE